MGICDLPTPLVRGREWTAPSRDLRRIRRASGDRSRADTTVAAAAVGAGDRAALLVDDLGITLHVLGTPAEGGGGKVWPCSNARTDGVHAAMMVHPTPREDIYACRRCPPAVHGWEAHAALRRTSASTRPRVTSRGRDRILRQHLRATDQIHGVVSTAATR
jgi:hypothetical protein